LEAVNYHTKENKKTKQLECQQVVSGLLNENKSVDVLYTDFEKAFDKVSHKKLLINFCIGTMNRYWYNE